MADETIVLPDWYEGNRVQCHSEHPLELLLRMTAEAHTRACRGLGANVLCRIFLNRDEGAWWPSKVGEVNPLIGDRDVAAEIVKVVHGDGMKVIAYFRHMSDNAMQTQHPDWVCKHPNGKPCLEPRGKKKTIYVICMNSPYRDYIRTRVVELAERGVDGIYFDCWHMPDICVCEYCKKAFRSETGRDMDPTAAVGSPGYMEAVAFVNRTMVRTFQDWRAAVGERHPNVLFVIKSSRYPMYYSPHISADLPAISPVSGTEYHKPFGDRTTAMKDEADFAEPAWDDQLALGWSVVRDCSAGRPPHMWIPFIRTERESLSSAAAAVTYGCVAAMNVPIRDPQEDGAKWKPVFASTFAMGDKVSPYLKHARPIPWAALHISERSRNARLADMKQMWREVFSPALGVCQALKEAHVPWVTVSDQALAEGLPTDTKVLILPWSDELTEKERTTVATFEKAGGVVVRLDPKAGWNTTAKKAELMKAMSETIGQKAPAPPIRITGPKAMHAVCYRRPDGKRLAICLTNTWGWFRPTREPDPKANASAPPPPCTSVTVTFDKSLGAPRRVVEAIAGADLKPENDGMSFRVPDFQINACVVAEF
ncbi:MAG: hypothetical protein AB1696_20745 [Planctomycetota bacterium]